MLKLLALAMAALAWACVAVPAAAADSVEVWGIGAAEPETLTVSPLAAPVTPAFSAVPQFAFDLSISGEGLKPAAASGTGTLKLAGGHPTLTWQIGSVKIGRKSVQGSGRPLAQVAMRLDARGVAQESVITFPGYSEEDAEGEDYIFLRLLVESLSSGWTTLPGQSLAMGQAAFDINRYLGRFFHAVAPGTLFTRPLPNGVVAGIVDYHGKQALVARFAGQGQVRTPRGVDVGLTIDGFALLDLATALPVYTDYAVTFQGSGHTAALILQSTIGY